MYILLYFLQFQNVPRACRVKTVSPPAPVPTVSTASVTATYQATVGPAPKVAMETCVTTCAPTANQVCFT